MELKEVLGTLLPDLEALEVDELSIVARRRVLESLPRLTEALRHVDLDELTDVVDCDCPDEGELEERVDELENEVGELEEERDKLKRRLKRLRRECAFLAEAISASSVTLVAPRRTLAGKLRFNDGRFYVAVNGQMIRLQSLFPPKDGS
ncbi:MAG TPA: hypothetical protein PK095_00025 [Myxococcota bacterium]|nr:hypothetical protein [Myxococcota bacterium]